MRNNNVTYFDSFGVEHIPKKTKAFINCSLSITTNIFKMQAYHLIIFVLVLLILQIEFTNLFSPNNFTKNDDIILNYFTSNA